jgi:RNA polymerase sigma-70 factor (sigma-E family)
VTSSAIVEGSAVGETEVSLAALFAAHHRRLLAFALLLSDDYAGAEDLVQEAFARLPGRHLADPERAGSYLRATVLNLSRSRLRRLRTARRHDRQPVATLPSAEESAMERAEHDEVLAALHRLSPRQRQAIVLRYWSDLPEPEIAAAMGVSAGAVKSHTHRAMTTLRRLLEADR